jgi:hypothetical protein
LSPKKSFRKKKKTQTSTTNGKKNAETAPPKTITTNDNLKKVKKNNNQCKTNIKYHIFEIWFHARAREVVPLMSQRAWDCPLYGFSVTGCFFGFLPGFRGVLHGFCHIPDIL